MVVLSVAWYAVCVNLGFFFCKQKTAYEMRISDWSSDVCSSDLKDIRTSGISVNPQYEYGDNQPPTITGYQASNTVSIKVREIDKLGEVLDALDRKSVV